mmetsp:Transcript_24463/g.59336  ORF Transcript_24463/g.59336 Transcript_24463/m.59336 type:complete len:233 (-) Transcript_24463:1607-2305(-)
MHKKVGVSSKTCSVKHLAFHHAIESRWLHRIIHVVAVVRRRNCQRFTFNAGPTPGLFGREQTGHRAVPYSNLCPADDEASTLLTVELYSGIQQSVRVAGCEFNVPWHGARTLDIDHRPGIAICPLRNQSMPQCCATHLDRHVADYDREPRPAFPQRETIVRENKDSYRTHTHCAGYLRQEDVQRVLVSSLRHDKSSILNHKKIDAAVKQTPQIQIVSLNGIAHTQRCGLPPL